MSRRKNPAIAGGGGGAIHGLPQAVQLYKLVKAGIIPEDGDASGISVANCNLLDLENAIEIWEKYVTSSRAIWDLHHDLKTAFAIAANSLPPVPRSPWHKQARFNDFFKDSWHELHNAGRYLGFGAYIALRAFSMALQVPRFAEKARELLNLGDWSNANAGNFAVRDSFFNLLKKYNLDKVSGPLELIPLIKILSERVDFEKVIHGKRRIHIFTRLSEAGPTEERVFVAGGNDENLDKTGKKFTRVNTIDELIKALLASISLRPIFPPVEINGRMYCDAGSLNLFPVEYLFDLGCDVVIALVKNYGVLGPDTNFFEGLLAEYDAYADTVYAQAEKSAMARAKAEGRKLFIIKPQRPLHPDLGLLWDSPAAIEHTIKVENEAMDKWIDKHGKEFI